MILLTERKENAKNNNQETTAQNANHIRIRCKLAERFPNIRDYITSQSNPSSQISTNIKRKVNPNKRNYREGNNNYYYSFKFKKNHLPLKKVLAHRKIYTHPPEKLKFLKDVNGRRAYYEGRIALANRTDSKTNQFRVFTDVDLGIRYKDQNKLQETVFFFLNLNDL